MFYLIIEILLNEVEKEKELESDLDSTSGLLIT